MTITYKHSKNSRRSKIHWTLLKELKGLLCTDQAWTFSIIKGFKTKITLLFIVIKHVFKWLDFLLLLHHHSLLSFSHTLVPTFFNEIIVVIILLCLLQLRKICACLCSDLHISPVNPKAHGPVMLSVSQSIYSVQVRCTNESWFIWKISFFLDLY